MSVPQHHPGKIMDIYSPTDKSVLSSDTSIQAMVKMWDGNTLVINVAPGLKGKIKVGDIVLVDYYPSEKFNTPIPKIEVVKVLRAELAKRITEEYKDYFKRTRKMGKKFQDSPAEQPHERYIG